MACLRRWDLESRRELQEGARHRMQGADARSQEPRGSQLRGKPAQEDQTELQESTETGVRGVEGEGRQGPGPQGPPRRPR